MRSVLLKDMKGGAFVHLQKLMKLMRVFSLQIYGDYKI